MMSVLAYADQGSAGRGGGERHGEGGGMDNVRMALKSVDGLLGLVTSLIDFESTDNYTLRLHVSEYELNSYLETTCEAFRICLHQGHRYHP